MTTSSTLTQRRKSYLHLPFNLYDLYIFPFKIAWRFWCAKTENSLFATLKKREIFLLCGNFHLRSHLLDAKKIFGSCTLKH